jgi:hypothetical protein
MAHITAITAAEVNTRRVIQNTKYNKSGQLFQSSKTLKKLWVKKTVISPANLYTGFGGTQIYTKRVAAPTFMNNMGRYQMYVHRVQVHKLLFLVVTIKSHHALQVFVPFSYSPHYF